VIEGRGSWGGDSSSLARGGSPEGREEGGRWPWADRRKKKSPSRAPRKKGLASTAISSHAQKRSKGADHGSGLFAHKGRGLARAKRRIYFVKRGVFASPAKKMMFCLSPGGAARVPEKKLLELGKETAAALIKKSPRSSPPIRNPAGQPRRGAPTKTALRYYAEEEKELPSTEKKPTGWSSADRGCDGEKNNYNFRA